MQTGKKKAVWALVFILLFGAGIAGGYFFVSQRTAALKEETAAPQAPVPAQFGDAVFVRIYYPVSDGRLVMEERRIPRSPDISVAEGAVEEFLKGPANGEQSLVPAGTKLLGIYRGSDGILYVDLSDECRRNFQGDAAAEFLLLKGLYESIISNVSGVEDVKVLIEGREIESIGGHILSLHPIKQTLAEIRQP